MERYKCPCFLDVVCISEDKGFFKVTSNGEIGDVKGLFKGDIDIKGIRYACGLMWYGGNYEIGGLIQRDDEFLEIVRIEAEDFFNNEDVKDGNVALLCALPLGNFDVYVAATAYMGNDIFLFASHVINVAAVWKNSDIILPEKTNINPKEIELIDVSNDTHSKSYQVSSKRYIIKSTESRTELFSKIKADLELLNQSVPKDEFFDAYGYGIDEIYFLTSNGIYKNNQLISDFTIDYDNSNPFSNYIFYCWEENICKNGSCYILDNGRYKLFVPKKYGELFVSGINSTKPKTYFVNRKVVREFEEAKWTDYFFVLSLDEEDKFVFNTPDKNLVEYINFTVPVIPEDVLANQNEEIDSIIGLSKITKYTKV